MNATRWAAAAVLLGLAGCSYSYKNPAEALGPGEVGGRTVAGVEVLVDGVSVAVQGAALGATSRANGRFTMLPLPVGRHSLMFRKGKERALQRDVEIAYGSDGQPQGLWLGDVTVPAAVTLRGSGEADDGASLAGNGVAVDEVSGAVVPFDGGFSFEGLSIGTHRIRIFVSDQQQQTYVGGPAEVILQPTDAGTQKTMTRISLHRGGAPTETGLVKLKFGVSGSIPDLKLADLKIDGLPASVGFGSDGVAQVDLPEGVYTVEVKLPAGLPIGVTAPPRKTFVAIKGRTLDLGTLYAVTDDAKDKAERSCRSDADCAPGTCTAGRCDDAYKPPAQAPANVPWCDLNNSGCKVGAYGGVYNGKPPTNYGPPYTSTCLGYGAATPIATIAVACGSSCTPDGQTVLKGEADKPGCLPYAPLQLTPMRAVLSGSCGQLDRTTLTASGGTPPYSWTTNDWPGNLVPSKDGTTAIWNPCESPAGEYYVRVTDAELRQVSAVAIVNWPPQIATRIPAWMQADVPVDTIIGAIFNEPLALASVGVGSIGVTANGVPVPGATALDTAGYTLVFTPAAVLPYGAYVEITVSGAVTDLLGEPLGNPWIWGFYTAAAPPPPPPAAPVIALPRTVSLVSQFAGDDASNVTGVAWPYPRFSDPGTTTPVTGPLALDRLTGLVWLSENRADFAGLTCAAVATPVNMVTWLDALALVQCLNDASYLGFNDWRLPNVLEVESLSVAARDLGHPFNWTGYLEYWSSTTFLDPVNGLTVWTADAAGSVRQVPASFSFTVWPVRGGVPGPAPDPAFPANLRRTGQLVAEAPRDDGDLRIGVTDPEPRFMSANGAAGQPCGRYDLLTGLNWIADAVPGGTDLQGALTAAGGTFCGYSDWRLPNRAELISLLDYSTGSSVATLATAGLFNTGATSVTQRVWSSTFQYWGDGNAFFGVELVSNEVAGIRMTDPAYVWLVRGGLPPAPVTVASVEVTAPSTLMTLIGTIPPTMACTALVTYSDNSIREVTTLSTWNSSNPLAIVVDPVSGLLMGGSQAGSSTITAAVGNVISAGLSVRYSIP